MLNFIRTRFLKPKLSQEAAEAYFYRLPSQIEVAWLRDGDVIVGKIKTADHEFMTQGRTADEFIEMVNDALVAAYDIPSDYIDFVREARAYTPTVQERERLESQQVQNSTFLLERNERVMRVA